ncbi:His Kinase A (phospho-acceptor) domain-containing protein [Flavobacterium sp. CF108]|uniref:sensor histidine kinase n=1 Tax=unclassified Flavobacterium TaxID=196869 RepID=UPI0008D6C8B6|nr:MULTISPECIES: ATP-binding protein [unclassified Flavobacterium]SEO62787.1 His Kinase A (phospho-acceptor) domain-containing protein [Flavobacterium sp. fv08]SHI07084.1 His Kinase A (phospho-acceptor) domain-containing protein [Flavobacterium sp. CF108]
MKSEQTEEKLKERVKELTCLYEISKTISQSNDIEKEVLEKIIFIIKNAWKFNDDAIVEIQVLDYHFLTSILSKNTIFQSSTINIPGTEPGNIKVHYPQNKYKPDQFLEDEQKLLNTAAIEIGNYIEKYQTLEKKDRLRRTIERIDRLSTLGEMTAGIAHELNNPLGNILGYAELIKLSNVDPEIDSDITTIIKSAIYTREIVKKLMFFSSEMPYQPRQEEIKPIVTFALSFLKQNFQKKEIKSELIIKNCSLTAKIDAVQITQVLFNLLINAIHASPQKSIIKTIVEDDAKNLFITIEDEGHGIPDAIKQKIFKSFFTTKTTTSGLGLGLSVVHGIVKTHNGEIIVQDNKPSGTIFTIKLPLS